MKPKVQRGELGRCSDPKRIIEAASRFGLAALDDLGIREARAMALSLLGDTVADEQSFRLLQQRFSASVLGFREDGEMTGVLAAFPVTSEGLRQLKCGEFDALHLNAALVASAGETPAAYYGWGFASTTKEGGRAVVKASVDIHRELYFATPTFARAVTSDGLRALTSIGFRPTSWADMSLLWIAPNSIGAAR